MDSAHARLRAVGVAQQNKMQSRAAPPTSEPLWNRMFSNIFYRPYWVKGKKLEWTRPGSSSSLEDEELEEEELEPPTAAASVPHTDFEGYRQRVATLRQEHQDHQEKLEEELKQLKQSHGAYASADQLLRDDEGAPELASMVGAMGGTRAGAFQGAMRREALARKETLVEKREEVQKALDEAKFSSQWATNNAFFPQPMEEGSVESPVLIEVAVDFGIHHSTRQPGDPMQVSAVGWRAHAAGRIDAFVPWEECRPGEKFNIPNNPLGGTNFQGAVLFGGGNEWQEQFTAEVYRRLPERNWWGKVKLVLFNDKIKVIQLDTYPDGKTYNGPIGEYPGVEQDFPLEFCKASHSKRQGGEYFRLSFSKLQHSPKMETRKLTIDTGDPAVAKQWIDTIEDTRDRDVYGGAAILRDTFLYEPRLPSEKQRVGALKKWPHVTVALYDNKIVIQQLQEGVLGNEPFETKELSCEKCWAIRPAARWNWREPHLEGIQLNYTDSTPGEPGDDFRARRTQEDWPMHIILCVSQRLRRSLTGNFIREINSRAGGGATDASSPSAVTENPLSARTEEESAT